MTLREIRGQERPLAQLRRALSEERLAHAYLFAGPPGVGKATAARALAQALLCAEAPNEGCGSCPACRQVCAGSHPDAACVSLEPGRHEVRIEQVRALQARLAVRAWGASGRKVGIVTEADWLSFAAQNALLKTLEEPSAGSLLILVAVNQSALLPTVLSRCHRLQFSPLPETMVAEILTTHHGVDPEGARLLAAYAEGGIGEALRLDVEALREARTRLLGLVRGDRVSFSDLSALCREVSQRATRDSRALDRFLRVALTLFHDRLLWRLRGAAAPIHNVDAVSEIAAGAAGLSVRACLAQLERVYATHQDIYRRNAQRQLALERMLLDIRTGQRHG